MSNTTAVPRALAASTALFVLGGSFLALAKRQRRSTQYTQDITP